MTLSVTLEILWWSIVVVSIQILLPVHSVIAYYRTTRKNFGAKCPGTGECLPEESPAFTSHPVTSSSEFFLRANGGHVSILLSFKIRFHRRLFTLFPPLVFKKSSRSDLLFIRYQCVKFIQYFDFLGLKIFGIRGRSYSFRMPRNQERDNVMLRGFRRRLPLMTLPDIMAWGLRKSLRTELTALCKMFVLINTIQAGLTTSCQIPGLRFARRRSFQLTLA